MRFLHHIRSMSRWPRALLVGLVLAFGLNTIAHAAHWHEPTTTASSLHGACSHCVGFGTLCAPPAPWATPLPSAIQDIARGAFSPSPFKPRPHSPLQARAPPHA
jgi:hypothetical protein